jgi:hypothetical protein
MMKIVKSKHTLFVDLVVCEINVTIPPYLVEFTHRSYSSVTLSLSDV